MGIPSVRVLFDVLGAPTRSGGMRLYADGVIRGWLERFPEDELVLLGEPWLEHEFGHLATVTVHRWKSASAPLRILGQWAVSAYFYRADRVDVLISLSPVVSPLVPRGRRISSVQDWRHIHHPREFSRAQLLYRRLWKRSATRANAVIAMSHKTARETAQFAPRARCILVETGRDYVSYWPEEGGADATLDALRIVTFGHHSNKRPELVIRALALMEPALRSRMHLVVLGARGAYRDGLEQLSRAESVAALCRFPGFVDEPEYRALFRSASVIVMMSSDEGFGLPVADAQYLGIPVVVSSDSGLGDLHDGVLVSLPIPRDLASALARAVSTTAEPALDATTWQHTAEGFRAVAESALRAARR